MKYVLLAIFVFFASQPVEAAPCDMHQGQGSPHSQHGDMPDGHMSAMDCCDDPPADSPDNCDPMSHCGACTAAVVAVNSSNLSAVFEADLMQYFPATNAPLNRFQPPPFRPPIA